MHLDFLLTRQRTASIPQRQTLSNVSRSRPIRGVIFFSCAKITHFVIVIIIIIHVTENCHCNSKCWLNKMQANKQTHRARKV